MNQQDVIDYLEAKAQWRTEVGETRCKPGSSGELKNQLYAHSLKRVVAYVAALPVDEPVLKKLEQVSLDVFNDDQDVHTHTIHCSLGRPPDIAKWLDKWADLVIAAKGGGD